MTKICSWNHTSAIAVRGRCTYPRILTWVGQHACVATSEVLIVCSRWVSAANVEENAVAEERDSRHHRSHVFMRRLPLSTAEMIIGSSCHRLPSRFRQSRKMRGDFCPSHDVS